MKPDFKKFADGLVPCVIQDNETDKVLMLGYMNEAAYKQTIADQKVTFYSRSKQRLWIKGESSGNYLFVKEMRTDCDQDCLLIKVNPAGPVCHTGADTCFGENNQSRSFLPVLETIIAERKNNPSAESYTSSLFSRGINKIAQKVGEEAVELVIEAKDDDPALFLNEAADLLFHFLILLQAKDIMLADVEALLRARNRHSLSSC